MPQAKPSEMQAPVETVIKKVQTDGVFNEPGVYVAVIQSEDGHPAYFKILVSENLP